MPSNRWPIRFLHIADVHLGFRQYNSQIREEDFFLAFENVIERFVLPKNGEEEPQVDFVLIAGDLFDHRNIQPITLSRATHVLSLMKEYNIPVIAIEGNHDAARWHKENEPNWYDYLCGEQLLIYLRDYSEEGETKLYPWDEEQRQGSYYDFHDTVRIIGTHWYGATAQTMLGELEKAIRQLPALHYTILMFHGGLTEYVNEMQAGVMYEKILPLRQYVDYIAMGHIHKQYNKQDWILNPGSLESCKIREYFENRGAYLVEIQENGTINLQHKNEYRQRPFIYLSLDTDLFTKPEEITSALLDNIAKEGVYLRKKIEAEWPEDVEHVAPFCYVELKGTLGFSFSTIDFSTVRKEIKETLNAKVIKFVNDTNALEYGIENYDVSANRMSRSSLEKKIFHSVLQAKTRYRDHANDLSELAIEMKTSAREQEFESIEIEQIASKIDTILQEKNTS